ncbi:Zn finger-containing GTPase- Activating Protein for ARF [Ceratobasidium sp. 414]|nr:Zn finger-containing GTPase- Activating Protein for ARF [Ceratobasidium sp. 414]
MADSAYAKKELLELTKVGDNKLVQVSTECGFGVHISYVLFFVSLTTVVTPTSTSLCGAAQWTLGRATSSPIGGNGPFKAFLKEYEPKEAGGFHEGMPLHDKYHCWATTQYREMLTAKLAGQPWAPSLPTETASDTASSGTLRKARVNTRGGLSAGNSRDTSVSPAPTPVDRKAANETYFSSLGEANASRPDNLPPSQGGRYVGFGSTPSPQPNSSNPNFGLSSAAAPTLSDIQNDPGAALAKGWGFLSTLVTTAARAANESVVQPGLERARDPALRAVVDQYTSRAAELGRGANDWTRKELGVDVASTASGAWSSLRGGAGGPGGHGGYGRVDEAGGVGASGWDSYRDDDHDTGAKAGTNKANDWDNNDWNEGWSATGNAPPAGTKPAASKAPAAPAKKDDEWEDW